MQSNIQIKLQFESFEMNFDSKMIKHNAKSVKTHVNVLEYDLYSKNDTIVITNIPFKINTSQKVICNQINDTNTHITGNSMNNLLFYSNSWTCLKSQQHNRQNEIHFKLIYKHHSIYLWLKVGIKQQQTLNSENFVFIFKHTFPFL